MSDNGPGRVRMMLKQPIAISPRIIGTLVTAPITGIVKILRAGRKLHWRIPNIGNVHNFGIKDGGAIYIFAREGDRKFPPPHFGAYRIIFVDCSGFDLIAVGQCQADGGIRKKIQSALHDGVEDRLRICRRIADDL